MDVVTPDASLPVRDGVGVVTTFGLCEATDLCRALRISDLPNLQKSQPLYLRATAVALRDRTCVHLVSMGNLLHDEAGLGVIACPYDEETRVSERGYCYETYNPSRDSCTIHNARHAFQSCGATWMLSVPVFAPGASVRPTNAIGFITCAWANAPSLPESYVHMLQEVAEGMAEGFQDVMAPILQEVVPNFLPFLLSPPPIPPTNSLLLQACGTNDNASEHNRKPPGGTGVPAGSTGSQASGANGKNGVEGSEGASTKSQGPASTSGTHAVPEVASPHVEGWADDDVALLKKKRPAVSGPDGAPRARMHPLLLHFDDGPLEAAFVAAQGQARRLADLMFSTSALVVSIGLALGPISRAGGYAMILGIMAALHLLVILFLPTWYLKNREPFCCLLSVVVSFGSLFCLSPTCVQSVLTPGSMGQIRFRTAALVRAATTLPIGLYLVQFVLQAGWRLGPFTATCLSAVPLLSAVGAMLFMLHKWEAAERTAFLSHAAARS